MLFIKIKDSFLELPLDTKIRLDFSFPLPTKDTIPSPKIYWFDIPDTPANNLVFNFANFLESERFKVYDCIFGFGAFEMAGKVVMKDAEKGKFKICLTLNPLSDPNASEKKLNTLDYGPDIVLGTNTNEVLSTCNNANENDDRDFVFPMIFNGKFYSDEKANNPDFGMWINKYDPILKLIKNEIHENPLPDNVHTLLPLFRLTTMLQKLFSINFAYHVKGDFYHFPDVEKLVIWNNYALDMKERKYFAKVGMNAVQSIPATPTSVLFNNETGLGFEDSDGLVFPGVFTYGVAPLTNNFYGYFKTTHKGYISYKAKFTIVHGGGTGPLTYSWGLLKDNGIEPSEVVGVGNTECTAGTEIDIEIDETVWYNGTDPFCLLWVMVRFDNNGGLCPGTVKDGILTVQNISESELNRYAKSIAIRNHMPAKTLSEVMDTLAKFFTLSIFFNSDSREVEFSFLENILKSPYSLDLTEHCIADSESMQVSESTGFQLDMNFENDDLAEKNFKAISAYAKPKEYLLTENLPTLELHGGLVFVKVRNQYLIPGTYEKLDGADGLTWKRFTDNFLPVKTSNDKSITDIKPDISTLVMRNIGARIHPEIAQPATSNYFEMEETDPGFKLLFWLRMQAFGSELWPLASSTRYNYSGEELTSFALRFNGPDGVFEKFGKQFYTRMADSDKATIKFAIDMAGFYEITRLFLPQNSQQPKRKIRIKNREYLPDEFHFVLGMNEVEECEAILYEIK